MKFPQAFRLCFIQATLHVEGEVCRRALVRDLGISQQQANLDFRAYHQRWPGAMTYDLQAKRYRPTQDAVGPLPLSYEPDLWDILRVAEIVGRLLLESSEETS